jgi:hypothetical protein
MLYSKENKMNPPEYQKPYEIIVKGINVVYGMVEDMKVVERIEKGRKADQARNVVEWLEWDLFLAKEEMKKAYSELEY